VVRYQKDVETSFVRNRFDATINGLLTNDTDPDTGDVLVITDVSGSSHVSLFDGRVTFSPGNEFAYAATGESTTMSCNDTVSDGHGATSATTVTIAITG
jgi:hypothetical protein